MNAEQQKAYDIGYKTCKEGVALTGKVMVDRSMFVINNYTTFSNPSWANGEGYDYYVKGFKAAEADTVVKAGTGLLVKILLVGAAVGMIFFFRKTGRKK